MYPKFVLWSFPVAALVATVFTIHSMTVHREIQAAKAGGISFHRLFVPLWPIGAVLTVAAFMLGTIVPTTNRRSAEVFKEREVRRDWRNNFVFQTEAGETLSIQQLYVSNKRADRVLLEKEDDDGARLHVWARQALYTEDDGWTLEDGYLRVVRPDGVSIPSGSNRSAVRAGPEPAQLLLGPRNEEEMSSEELGRQGRPVIRSGGDPNELAVAPNRKLAIRRPHLGSCASGAPLATTASEGGRRSRGWPRTTLIYILLLSVRRHRDRRRASACLGRLDPEHPLLPGRGGAAHTGSHLNGGHTTPSDRFGASLPEHTSSTGPRSRTDQSAVASTSIEPPSMTTVAAPGVMKPHLTAAATAAHADVPDAVVGPTPRSQIRIATSRPEGMSANCTFVPRGKASCLPINGP